MFLLSQYLDHKELLLGLSLIEQSGYSIYIAMQDSLCNYLINEI